MLNSSLRTFPSSLSTHRLHVHFPILPYKVIDIFTALHLDSEEKDHASNVGCSDAFISDILHVYMILNTTWKRGCEFVGLISGFCIRVCFNLGQLCDGDETFGILEDKYWEIHLM